MLRTSVGGLKVTGAKTFVEVWRAAIAETEV